MPHAKANVDHTRLRRDVMIFCIQEMNKSGVWKSLESKPAETMEGEERSPVSKDNTPDEGIVIKVSQLRGQLV